MGMTREFFLDTIATTPASGSTRASLPAESDGSGS